RRIQKVLLACAVLAFVGCGERATTVEEYYTREVKLPNGKKIRAEVMINPTDMMRGMMFRDSIAPNRGMLFIHSSLEPHRYWMFQVKIPLDIIWMDENRRIVEISANTPPCQTGASDCQQYGGAAPSLYVLEVGGGVAAKHNLRVGQQLSF
ncbi:MAG: DUF192 domain-containing protein, partial [Bryobacteraceae bacterium]